MNNRRVLSIGTSVGFLFLLLSSTIPSPAQAAWVNAAGTQFTVGGNLRTITPTSVGSPPGIVDPACDSPGATSLALVPGLKLAGVDPVLYPIVLVVSCIGGESAAIQRRLNFISPGDGKVIKQISTTAVPASGWAHLIHRPDKGDLLGCGVDGSLYSIDFSQATATTDGTATPLLRPAAANACTGLAWDAEVEMIYQGTGNKVVRFKEGPTAVTTIPATSDLPCTANGLAISGGVLLLSCNGEGAAIRRVDKNTGTSLGVHGTLNTVSGLGGLACDPVTFHKDALGRDLFTDALWSRRVFGEGGDSVVALEFPAFTCGMPSNSVVLQGGVPFSPLAAGLSTGTAALPGQLPLAACFDTAGKVIDADGDGLPDCWEGASFGIDFSGRGTNAARVFDLTLCVFVDTNGDGIPDTNECADPARKDLFVEIDYMQFHKPDPKALSQTQTVASVGVKSVREAFAAAPVSNPAPSPTGIKIHFQVDEQVTFTPHAGGSATSHVTHVAFTPCTGPASAATNPADAVDFDVVKAGNFGTSMERGNPNSANILNAKRLAFRYVFFAHNLVGNPSGGSTGSGCAEVGGDDAVVTLGSFAATTVATDIPPTHNRGTTDQQAGTFMHELGHTLGFRHGGSDGNNCKPNYRSVMSYTRQFAGSPILNRRLDYSRSKDPVLTSPTLTGILNEGSLNETLGLGSDPSLAAISPHFPLADQIAFGPNAWALRTTAQSGRISWNRDADTNDTTVNANINQGATAGCDGVGTTLVGHDDWRNLLYRSSAAIDFAGARSNDDPVEMTSENEQAFFLTKDVDSNGAGDGTDCGGAIDADGNPAFFCTHRMDTPKGIKRTGNFEIVIFSERNGSRVWDAPAQVRANDTLTISLESVVIPVKVNHKGKGTCAAADRPDPTTGLKDGIRDLHCQVHVTGITLPTGTLFAIVSGFFFDPLTKTDRAFSARQLVTIVE